MEKRWLMRDGSDLPVSNGEAPLSCQDAFMIEAEEAASHAAVKPHGIWQKMTARFLNARRAAFRLRILKEKRESFMQCTRY